VISVASGGAINGKPVLACWMGSHAAREGRAILSVGGVANYETPSDVAAAVTYLQDWSRAQESLVRTPGGAGRGCAFDREQARAIFRAAAAEGRRMLTEPEAKAVVSAYGIATPETVAVKTPADVEVVAASLLARSARIAVKLLSKTISHKSDIGGVVLNIETAQAARVAAETISGRISALGNIDALDGFAVQEMIERRDAHELILGLTRDPILGPAVLFGAGGVSVEVVNDNAIALPPLDDMLAGDVIDRTRIGKLLAGYRDRPAAHRQALLDSVCALSQLAVDFRCIVSLDINPLLADRDGVIALDARIEIDPADVDAPAPNSTLAIRPIPDGWDKDVTLEATPYFIRPIRPADAALYPPFLAKVDPEDLRLRFFSPRGHFSDRRLIRLTQIDYEREMAFVALDKTTGELAGIGRLAADPDYETAEFTLLVRSDLQGHGLGRALLSHLRDFARADGLRTLEGIMLDENQRMLKICALFGFMRSHRFDQPGLVHMKYVLMPQA